MTHLFVPVVGFIAVVVVASIIDGYGGLIATVANNRTPIRAG